MFTESVISALLAISLGSGTATLPGNLPAKSPAAEANGVDKTSVKTDLQTVCKLTPTEPACTALADLSEAEAWVVLYEACRSNPARDTETCQTFRQRQIVLVYDFHSDDWVASWEGAPYDLKFDVAGTPTLRLKPGHAKPLKILVDNISPLTYSALPGEAKEEDLSIIAGLKSFLTLAGTGIQGLVQTVTFSATASRAGNPVDAPSADPFASIFSKTDSVQPKSKAGSDQPSCNLKKPSVAALAKRVTDRNLDLVDLSRKMNGLDTQLDNLSTARVNFLKTVQKAEDGKDVLRSELTRPALSELDTAYREFERTALRLSERTNELTLCQPMLSAFLSVLGAPPDGSVVKALSEGLLAASGCALADVTASLRMEAEDLRVNAVKRECEGKPLEENLKLRREAFKPFADRLLNPKQAEEKVWTAIDKVRTSKNEVLAGADILDRQVQKGQRHTWNDRLIRNLAVNRQNPELPWNKQQTHEIVIKAESPYVKELSLRRPAEVKRPYKLESATGQVLGYGVGMVYTPLQESTFGAVTGPDGVNKVIGETKRETRAGDLAAFLTYRFTELHPRRNSRLRYARPTLELGVGLTSDRPAFFLGGGIELFRAARVGFGWAPQRVLVLAEGQTLNETIVKSTEDIRTEKRFDTGNYYVSFTFALDSLSLFNGK